jgi:cyclase
MSNKSPMHHNAIPRIFTNAKELRQKMTYAEKLMWQILKNRSIHGLKFRRQHPLYSFIADFYCHELLLVIELDGSIHLLPEVQSYDINRQQVLEKLGLHVLRFTNDSVINDLDNVIKEIIGFASGKKPQSCPSPNGEGVTTNEPF